MTSRSTFLRLIQPDLDDAVLARAGGMLDDVIAYLDSVEARELEGTFPVFAFDPVAASDYLPNQIELPSAGSAAPADPDDLPWVPAGDLGRLVRDGEVGAAEVAELHARRIREWEPALGAFIRPTLDDPGPPHAKDGTRAGPLAGVPIGLSDLIDVAGLPTTAGSAILRDHVADTDAECWDRLAGAGAVLAGKLNVHEFAAGTTGENLHYGWTRNPWDLTRMAGGACGGAGAAVAAGLVSAALGPDPGGSIRVPAAHCGVVALKPTYGAVSRRGVLPLTWTLDTLGMIAQRVRGAAAIADRLLTLATPWGLRQGCEAAALAGESAPELDVTIGVPTSWLDLGLDPAVRRAFEGALDHLTGLGAKIREVEVTDARDILRMHRAIAFSEASAAHERFLRGDSARLGANIVDREQAGRAMLAGDYLKAARIRTLLCRDFSQIWREVDILATPTVPVTAAPIGTPSVSTGSHGPEATHTVYTRYLAPLSSLGLPAISVPCGVDPAGLPIGLQLAGPPHAEALLFFVAGAYEATTGWHTRHPEPPKKESSRV